MNRMDKPTVLIIGPTPPPYFGPSVATRAILESPILSDRFEIVHLDTADRREALNFGKLDCGNLVLGVKNVFGLARLLATSRPHLVYVQISQGSLAFLRDSVFVLLSRLARARVVVHLRGSYFRRFYESANGLVRLAIRLVLRVSSRVLVLSESLKSVFEGLVLRERLGVAFNGLELEEWPPARASGNGSKPTVLFLGNLFSAKGYQVVVFAIPYVRANCPDAKFVFAGSAPSIERERHVQDEVADFIQRQGISDCVEFAGDVAGDEKKRLLHASSMLVFPPVMPEGQPWVVLEGLAAGLPVVATDQGCISEMVVDGHNGFIVPPGRPVPLAERISQLLTDPSLREEMGRRSRRLIERRYTRQRSMQGLAAVFEEVVRE